MNMKMSAFLRKAILFPFLLPVFFVLHTCRYLFDNIPVGGAMAVMVLYLGITAVLYLIIRKISKHGVGAGVATTLLMALFIYWGEVVRFVNKLLHTANFVHLPALFAIWIIVTILLAKTVNKQQERTRARLLLYFNVLFVLYIGVEGGRLIYAVAMREGQQPIISRTTEDIDRTIKPTKGPNVYLLLFDEYSSTASLREEWGYDNSWIDSMLVARSFKLNSTSKSNYQLTPFSMATMLNMDYFTPGFEQKYIGAPDYPKVYELIERAKVVSLFKERGYGFYNLSIFDIDGQPRPDLRDLLVDGRDLLTVNNLYHVTKATYIPYLQNRQAIKHNPNFHDPAFYYFDIYNNKRMQDLLQVARQQSDKPKFAYAHFLMPHAPFFYDSVGNYLPVAVAKQVSAPQSTQYYWHNVKHTNKKMLEMVDGILKSEHGNAIIVVLGDHGFRGADKTKEKDEIFRNFSAVYFPDKDYSGVPDTVTNVNIFRIVLNKVFNGQYPLLPNKSVKLEGESRVQLLQ